MKETKYSEAAVEVLDILNYTNQEDVRKIPQSFMKFLTEIANKNYKVNFNHNGPISGLNLRKQTRELLGFIYITWWCNDKDRNNYKNIIHSNNSKSEQIENIDNYDIDDIFKNKKETKTNAVTENIIEKERLRIDEILESFKKNIEDNYSTVEAIAEVFSKEEDSIDNKIENKLSEMKENIIKEIPMIEDISQIFIEEKDSLREEFDSLRNEILNSMPTLEYFENIYKGHEAEIKNNFSILEEDFSESIKRYKDNIMNEIYDFKNEFVEKISVINNLASNLQIERDRLSAEIEDIKTKYESGAIYSNEALNSI